MKFFKLHDIPEGCMAPDEYFIMIGHHGSSLYIVINSLIKYTHNYIDPYDFNSKIGIGFNRHLITFRNKKLRYIKFFQPMRRSHE